MFNISDICLGGANKKPGHLSRQPGYLYSRPVAFRPHLSMSLALAEFTSCEFMCILAAEYQDIKEKITWQLMVLGCSPLSSR